MKNIEIKTIPHKEQRYPTVGDYFEEENEPLQFRISELDNADYEFLVLIHEMIEHHLIHKRGITIEDIDTYDKRFEMLRETFPNIIGYQEPGNMSSAPYHAEHVFATLIEKIIAKELDVDWEEYDRVVNAL